MSIYEQQQIDYEWIKRAAKHRGVSVADLVALAPQNDPFYTGTRGDIELGRWFAEVWQQIGDERMHLRRVHYWLVAQGTAVFPNGKPYENTLECWDMLNMASKAARYLRYVDPEAFNDRRTPEVMLFASDREYADPYVYVSSASEYRLTPKLPDFPSLPGYTVGGYHAEQPYHLEVFCEKSTMNDVLAPLCQTYGANLQTGAGEMSITATLALVRRIEQADKPARVFYVSDFDPAGQSMPVAVSRKIEYFVRSLGLDLDIRVFPVVLTLDQVQYYQLPRTPIKESERRREGFEARHGQGAVELDALEALYPGELRRILADYIEQYYDVTLAQRVEEQRRALEERLHGFWQQVMASYQTDIQALRQEYDQVKAESERQLSGFSQRLQGLWKAIKDDLSLARGVEEEYPMPVAQVGEEVGEGLYNSERDYLDQIEVYKQFQGRG